MMAFGTFKQIRVNDRDDVVVIEITCTDIQGPERAEQFSSELTTVASDDSTKPILLDMLACTYLSSMGYSALFKLVKTARERQRPVKFCNMHADVRSGANAVGLYHVVDVLDSQAEGISALTQPQS